jgi:hypothetical protein
MYKENHAQLLARLQYLLENDQEEVDFHRPLMHFVNDDVRHVGDGGGKRQAAQQDARRYKQQTRVFAQTVLHANLGGQ